MSLITGSGFHGSTVPLPIRYPLVQRPAGGVSDEWEQNWEVGRSGFDGGLNDVLYIEAFQDTLGLGNH